MGRRLARHKVGAVGTSRRRSMLDPVTSLRYAWDDIGWGALDSGLVLRRWLVGGQVSSSFPWHDLMRPLGLFPS